jgi:hypothetical protein
MQLALLERAITPDTVLQALSWRIGPANGVTVRQLASEILGTPSTPADERDLRQVIVKLRRDGHPVCATPDEGYHHAANADDLERTCLHLTHRAMTTLRQVAAMQRKAVPDLYGQLGLPPPINDSGDAGDA